MGEKNELYQELSEAVKHGAGLEVRVQFYAHTFY